MICLHVTHWEISWYRYERLTLKRCELDFKQKNNFRFLLFIHAVKKEFLVGSTIYNKKADGGNHPLINQNQDYIFSLSAKQRRR